MQPQPGENLRLTIDVGLQRAAEKALRFGIQTAHQASEPYADGGAIVALDPNDGSVLAMASYPTYQPSRLRRSPRREEARAAARPEGRREGELPGAEPRDRRELSAGLDVQAGDGARRDGRST